MAIEWGSERNRPHGLSLRQWQVLRMKAGGISDADAGKTLLVGVEAIRTYLKQGRRKLKDAGLRTDAVSLHRLVEEGQL